MLSPDLVGAVWRKSSRSSGNGQCTMCARLEDGSMAVKDSKNPDGPALVFTAQEWSAFVEGVKLGEFD
jgi:Domain of unknown function (DUF397)